jgi:hypothetical protein
MQNAIKAKASRKTAEFPFFSCKFLCNDVQSPIKVTQPPNSRSDSVNRVAQDLERLKEEIRETLQEMGMPVFYGRSRTSKFPVFWDTARHDDFRQFLSVARNAGAKLIVFSEQQFMREQIEDTLCQLGDCELPGDEIRKYENQLRKFKNYEGFTCSLELSFDIEARAYFFETRAEWYDSFLRTASEIEAWLPDLEDLDEDAEEDDGGRMGGYFSNN